MLYVRASCALVVVLRVCSVGVFSLVLTSADRLFDWRVQLAGGPCVATRRDRR